MDRLEHLAGMVKDQARRIEKLESATDTELRGRHGRALEFAEDAVLKLEKALEALHLVRDELRGSE